MSFPSPVIYTKWRFVIPVALVTCFLLTGCVINPPNTVTYNLLERYMFEGEQDDNRTDDNLMTLNPQDSAFIPTDKPLKIRHHGL